MAYSYVIHTADSGTVASKKFNIQFSSEPGGAATSNKPYISATHIKTKVNDVENTDFTVDEDTAISTLTFGSSTTLLVGDNVRVYRSTPNTLATRSVDFQDASLLSEADLDTAIIQSLFTNQESIDNDDASLKESHDGIWDGESKRMKNIATAIAANDVVTKDYVDTQAIFNGVAAAQAWKFGPANGTTEKFELVDPLPGGLANELYIVEVGGTLQAPSYEGGEPIRDFKVYEDQAAGKYYLEFEAGAFPQNEDNTNCPPSGTNIVAQNMGISKSAIDGNLQITASQADATPLILQGYAGQTADLLLLKDSDDNEKFKVSNLGAVDISSTLVVNQDADQGVDADAATHINAAAADKTGLTIRGFVDQTDNLQEWQDNTGAVKADVTSAGAGRFLALRTTGEHSHAIVPAIVTGASSQSVNLQDWKTNADAVLASVDKDGGLKLLSTDGAAFPVQIVKDGTSNKLFIKASTGQVSDNVNLAEFVTSGDAVKFALDETATPSATLLRIGGGYAGTEDQSTYVQLRVDGGSGQAASTPVLQVRDAADAECFAVNPDKSVDVAGDLAVTGGLTVTGAIASTGAPFLGAKLLSGGILHASGSGNAFRTLTHDFGCTSAEKGAGDTSSKITLDHTLYLGDSTYMGTAGVRSDYDGTGVTEMANLSANNDGTPMFQIFARTIAYDQGTASMGTSISSVVYNPSGNEISFYLTHTDEDSWDNNDRLAFWVYGMPQDDFKYLPDLVTLNPA